MTLRELVGRVRRFWPLAAAVFFVVMAAGVAATYLPAERFRSSATVIVQPKAERALEFGQAVAAEFLLPTVVEQVHSQAFERRVLEASRTRLSSLPRDAVSGEIRAVNEPGTGIVTIEVTSETAAVPDVVANAAADELADRPISPILEILVLDPAQPAESASAALRLPILFASLVLAVIAALVAAVAFGSVRRRLDTAETIREQFGLEVLGEIPAHRRLPVRASELFSDPRQRHAAEDYQKLRTVFEIVARGRSAVAVTSWTQGEGKTTVTANVAWAIAAAGRPVLAVDCDLRRPQLHDHLGVALTTGVADIGRRHDLDDLVVETELPTLDVLTAGVADRHPTELLREAVPMIAAANQEDRLVLIDTPPMFTPETTTIATLIDAVVIVIDGRRRDASELQSLVQDLRLAGTEILGVVVNRARVRGRRRASEYYYQPIRPAPPRRAPLAVPESRAAAPARRHR